MCHWSTVCASENILNWIQFKTRSNSKKADPWDSGLSVWGWNVLCVSPASQSMSDINQLYFIEALTRKLNILNFIQYWTLQLSYFNWKTCNKWFDQPEVNKTKKHTKTNKNASFCFHMIVFNHTNTECVLLTFAWARVRAWTGPCRSLLCEETLNESGAGRDAAAPAQPECYHAPSPWSCALHLHTHAQLQYEYTHARAQGLGSRHTQPCFQLCARCYRLLMPTAVEHCKTMF